MNTAICVYQFGAVVGCNLSDKFRKTGKLHHKWWNTSIFTRIIRWIISAGFSYGVYYFFNYFTFTYIEISTEFTMGFALPSLISTIVYTGLFPYAFKSLYLVNRDPNPVELQNRPQASQPLNPSSLTSSSNP